METIKAFWTGLTTTQRNIIIGFVGLILLIILVSFISGTDYAGFGSWIQSWFN